MEVLLAFWNVLGKKLGAWPGCDDKQRIIDDSSEDV
jgi:hypothetical protein